MAADSVRPLSSPLLQYRVSEVHPLNKKELSFSANYKKVPIATVMGLQLNDSNDIISALYSALPAVQSPADSGKFSAAVTSRTVYWREWTDAVLVHLFPPNIYQTIGQS